MRRKGLRLWAKGVWCSCQTVFAVERGNVAKIASPRPSSMSLTSSIPPGSSLFCEDCSLWLEFSASGVHGVAGYLAEGSPPSPLGCEVWSLGVFDRTHSSAC